MAKKEPKATGRPRVADDLTALQMLRAHLEQDLSTRTVAALYKISKSRAHAYIADAQQRFPEFCKFLKGLSEETTALTPSEEDRLVEFKRSEEKKLHEHFDKRLEDIKKDLAAKIEDTIAHLLDMTPEQIAAIKPTHRLGHIPELVKAMRLLREQSTENVQKLSLSKVIGIATARRQPTAGEGTSGVDE